MLDDLDLQCSKIVKIVEQAVRSSNEFGSHFRVCAAALYVRAATTQVRAALPVGRAELPARLESCNHDSEMLRKVNQQHFAILYKHAQDAMSDDKAIFSRDVTRSRARKAITD